MKSMLTLVALLSSVIHIPLAVAQERTMDVRHKPDAVFSQPVDQLAPELRGAKPTNENGRVGGELVFWGYTLADGRPVYLFACAGSELVNCDERVQKICVDRTTVLTHSGAGGNVAKRQCRSMAIAGTGDIRPGCVENVVEAALDVGVVSCG
jgi:hypothetical protein